MTSIMPLKTSFIAFGFCIASLLVGCEQNQHSLALLDTAPLTLPEPEGRWVVVNYWAEWCKPCLKEIPELNLLDRDSGDKVRVIGVNFDGLQGDDLRAAKQRFAISFDLLLEDPRTILAFAAPTAIPVTYLIEPEGSIAAKLVGPQTKETLLAEIERLQNSHNRL